MTMMTKEMMMLDESQKDINYWAKWNQIVIKLIQVLLLRTCPEICDAFPFGALSHFSCGCGTLCSNESFDTVTSAATHSSSEEQLTKEDLFDNKNVDRMGEICGDQMWSPYSGCLRLFRFGLRASEVLRLTRDDIRLAHDTPHIRVKSTQASLGARDQWLKDVLKRGYRVQRMRSKNHGGHSCQRQHGVRSQKEWDLLREHQARQAAPQPVPVPASGTTTGRPCPLKHSRMLRWNPLKIGVGL